MKTKLYTSPSAGQAWDVHQHVYQDYEHFIHNTTSNIILTKHSVFQMKRLCRCAQKGELTRKMMMQLVTMTLSGLSHQWVMTQCDLLTPSNWPLSGWSSHWPTWTMNHKKCLLLDQIFGFFFHCPLHFYRSFPSCFFPSKVGWSLLPYKSRLRHHKCVYYRCEC